MDVDGFSQFGQDLFIDRAANSCSFAESKLPAIRNCSSSWTDVIKNNSEGGLRFHSLPRRYRPPFRRTS
jgi:hypothetical protein